MPDEQCIYGGEFEGIISKDVFERTQQNDERSL